MIGSRKSSFFGPEPPPAGRVRVREAQEADAHALLRLKRQVFTETENLLQTVADYDFDAEEERYLIRRYRYHDGSALFVAEVSGRLQGFVTLQGGALVRNRHVAQLGIAVRQQAWGLGIGRELMARALDWAHGTPQITRLSLLVYAENHRAMELYEQFGFQREGVLRNEVWLSEQRRYVDLVAMGLLVGAPVAHI